jgi:hypothetical protein
MQPRVRVFVAALCKRRWNQWRKLAQLTQKLKPPPHGFGQGFARCGITRLLKEGVEHHECAIIIRRSVLSFHHNNSGKTSERLAR